MRLREKVNPQNPPIEVDDERGRALLATNLFDRVDDGEAVTQPPAAPPVKSRRRPKAQ